LDEANAIHTLMGTNVTSLVVKSSKWRMTHLWLKAST
jgi:hypothetical protein